MTKQTVTHRPLLELFTLLLCGVTVITALLLVVPIWTGFTVGIASTSLIIFSSLGLLLLICLLFGHASSRPIVLSALCVALLGLLVPQLAFMRTASLAGASLSFDPLSYIHFSGDPDIKPTRTFIYKTAGSSTLELSYYKPEIDGTHPAVVLLHGGAWRYGNHLETGAWPQILTKAGYAVVSIEYRLASDTYHTWQDAPQDVHDAVNYIKSNAEPLGIKPERISLLGQSAGGHLALLEAYTSSDIHSVVSLYAPLDLAVDYQTSRDKSAELDFIGGPPAQFAKRYESVSPFSFVSHSTPPTLLIQGKSDDLVDANDTLRLGDALQNAHVAHEVLLLPLTGHSFENQRGGFATQIAQQRVLEFLSK